MRKVLTGRPLPLTGRLKIGLKLSTYFYHILPISPEISRNLCVIYSKKLNLKYILLTHTSRIHHEGQDSIQEAEICLSEKHPRGP